MIPSQEAEYHQKHWIPQKAANTTFVRLGWINSRRWQSFIRISSFKI